MTDETTRCRFCGEEILAVAIKCKHCHSDLRESSTPEVPAATEAGRRESWTPDVPVATEAGPQSDYGTFLIAIPVVGAALVWLWIGQMSLIQSPGTWSWLIVILVIAATAILAQREDAAGGSGDAKWPVTMALVWVIAYPAYLRHRESRGLPNLLVPGVVAAILFLGSLWAVQSGINTAVAEVNAEIAKFETESAAAVAELNRGMASAEAEFNRGMASSEAEFHAAMGVAVLPADTGSEGADAPVAAPSEPTENEPTENEPPPDVTAIVEAGAYAADDGQTLRIELVSESELQFTLTLGATAAGEACEEGAVDCITLSGSAERAGDGYQFAPDEDCAFSIHAVDGALTISDSAGRCGTGTANDHLLQSIDGTYTRISPAVPGR